MEKIETQKQELQKQGLRENIDYRIVYFDQTQEIKIITKLPQSLTI